MDSNHFYMRHRISLLFQYFKNSFLFVFDLLILRTLNLSTHILCRFGTSFQWRIRESNP